MKWWGVLSGLDFPDLPDARGPRVSRVSEVLKTIGGSAEE